jgi:SAM-dependent methyltransferase
MTGATTPAPSPVEPAPDLPYFDLLLQQLQRGEPGFSGAFGRHVHWGSWEDPSRADGSVADFAVAAERLTERLIEAAAIAPGQRILDAGCGFGGTLARLNEGGECLDLTGLNIDPRQLERAAASLAPRPSNRLAWVVGDACAMPFAAASFDRLLAVECIFHFPSREAFFREAARVLRPGGRLTLCDFVPSPTLRVLQRFTGGVDREMRATYGPVDCSFSVARYRRLGDKHGFRLLIDADITRSTLPTYPVVAGLFAAAGWPEAEAATRRIGLASRLGLMRYRILSFEQR